MQKLPKKETQPIVTRRLVLTIAITYTKTSQSPRDTITAAGKEADRTGSRAAEAADVGCVSNEGKTSENIFDGQLRRHNGVNQHVESFSTVSAKGPSSPLFAVSGKPTDVTVAVH